jgi:hypothetical protein
MVSAHTALLQSSALAIHGHCYHNQQLIMRIHVSCFLSRTAADFYVQTSRDSEHCLAVCSADRFANISQGMRGYVSVMAVLKFIYILFKGECFVRNNRKTPLIRDMFISYDRQNVCVRSF